MINLNLYGHEYLLFIFLLLVVHDKLLCGLGVPLYVYVMS